MTSKEIIRIANISRHAKLEQIKKIKDIGGGDLIEAKIICQNRFDRDYKFVELYNLLYRL